MTCNMCSLWQRLGRAARKRSLEAIALILVEAKYFDDERAKKTLNKAKKNARNLKKRKLTVDNTSHTPAKRTRQARTSNTLKPSTPVREILAPYQYANSNVPNLEECAIDPMPELPETDNSDDSWESEEEGEERKPLNGRTVEHDVITCSPVLQTASVEDLTAIRRQMYLESSKGKVLRAVVKKKDPDAELDIELMDLVNARERGLGCRRLPIWSFFSSNFACRSNCHIWTLTLSCALLTATDHLLCDTSISTGCSCCCLTPSTSCCDIHTPERFQVVAPLNVQRLPRGKRSTLPKTMHTVQHSQLREALCNWRAKKTAIEFSMSHLADIGPSLVLPNAILDRIVICAQVHKISTVEQLRKETRWTESVRYSEEILGIIQLYIPWHVSNLPSEFYFAKSNNPCLIYSRQRCAVACSG